MTREIRLGNLNGYTGGNFSGNVYHSKGLSPLLTTCQGGGRQPMIIEDEMSKGYRIRKLTPIEAFKLMGLREEDCKKASAAGVSNSQLYKCAGNGIITNCVELLFEHLYKAQYNPQYKCFDENFTEAVTV